MYPQVKIFTSGDGNGLETNINEFLGTGFGLSHVNPQRMKTTHSQVNTKRLLDIKYCFAEDKYSAMVIYE